ncbi:MAG: hypothetical protein VX000_09105, partial [Myxococcota bacterium]|nr:hypothetical protein [Myxococcota bacterium]
VEAPAAPGVVGPVAVRIETDGGESTLSDAFHYWEDATGEAVTVLRARAVRGWDERGTWDDFQAIGWNTLPVDRWSTDNQAGMSSCTASYGDPALQPAPDELVLSGELGTLTLEQDAGSEALYYDADEPSLEELAGTRHDVSVPAGGTWPAYTVSDGIAFPDDITLFSPSPYGYDSYDQDDFAIEWEAWGADRILIGFLDASSDAVAICAVPDTGDYTVPPDAYGGFVPSESGWWGEAWVMQVVVLAYRDTSSVLDFNNGELRAQGGIGYATWVRVEDSWF